MIPLIGHVSDTSPAQAKPRTDGGLDSNSHRSAWKREMERAQSEAWFKAKATAPHDQHRASAARRSAATQALGAAGISDSAATHRNGDPVASVGIAATEPSNAPPRPPSLPARLQVPTASERKAPLGSGQVAVAMPSTPATGSRHGAPDAACSGAETGRAAVPLFPGQRKPVRMHAQWDGNDVSLWLGLDADQATDASRLVDTLRALLQGQGLRPVSIVCNGQLAWRADDAPHAPTTRSGDDPTSRRLNATETQFHIIATREP
ncbi:MAG: hypothetical protein KF892_09995 [Rhizobacter sp.]|nr:hypothetical protein [Rhizobacter sp.]